MPSSIKFRTRCAACGQSASTKPQPNLSTKPLTRAVLLPSHESGGGPCRCPNMLQATPSHPCIRAGANCEMMRPFQRAAWKELFCRHGWNAKIDLSCQSESALCVHMVVPGHTCLHNDQKLESWRFPPRYDAAVFWQMLR